MSRLHVKYSVNGLDHWDKRCWIWWENTGMQKYDLVMSFQAQRLLQVLHEGTPAQPTTQPLLHPFSPPLSGPVPQNFFTFLQLARFSLAFRLLSLYIPPSRTHSSSPALGGPHSALRSWWDAASRRKPLLTLPAGLYAVLTAPRAFCVPPIHHPPAVEKLVSCQRCLLEGELVEDRDSVQVTPNLFVHFIVYSGARHSSSRYSSKWDRKIPYPHSRGGVGQT